ncbi:hypothetical protein QAD02_008167 [Eretmocerus hayati]|uniref:Uncharacterized protein n=1 Tax=Eretmocerus hayati TaxID=131215 RepID=A0ACC2N5N5_9HYME|nr:hypothetical protein QAD02_008167 [Eretmocerus hayati]
MDAPASMQAGGGADPDDMNTDDGRGSTGHSPTPTQEPRPLQAQSAIIPTSNLERVHEIRPKLPPSIKVMPHAGRIDKLWQAAQREINRCPSPVAPNLSNINKRSRSRNSSASDTTFDPTNAENEWREVRKQAKFAKQQPRSVQPADFSMPNSRKGPMPLAKLLIRTTLPTLRELKMRGIATKIAQITYSAPLLIIQSTTFYYL